MKKIKSNPLIIAFSVTALFAIVLAISSFALANTTDAVDNSDNTSATEVVNNSDTNNATNNSITTDTDGTTDVVNNLGADYNPDANTNQINDYDSNSTKSTTSNDYHPENPFTIDFPIPEADTKIDDFPVDNITIDGEPDLSVLKDEQGTNGRALAFYQSGSRITDTFEAGRSYKFVIVFTLADGQYYSKDVNNLASFTSSEIDIFGQYSCKGYSYGNGGYAWVGNNNPPYFVKGSFSIPEKSPLSSIAVTTEPKQTEYKVGESFNPDGMVVTATYEDGTTKDVTGYTTSPDVFSTRGYQAVTITYAEDGVEVTTTQYVNVIVDPHPNTPFNVNIATPSAGNTPKDFIPNKSITVTGDSDLALKEDDEGTNGYAVSFFDSDNKRLSDDEEFVVGESYKAMVILNLTSDDYYSEEANNLASSSDITIEADNNHSTYSYNLDDCTSTEQEAENQYYGIVGSFTVPEEHKPLPFEVNFTAPLSCSTPNDFQPTDAIKVNGDTNLVIKDEEKGTNGYAVSFFGQDGERIANNDEFIAGNTYKAMVILKLNSKDYYNAEVKGLASSKDIQIDENYNYPASAYDIDNYKYIDTDMTNPMYGIVGEFTVSSQHYEKNFNLNMSTPAAGSCVSDFYPDESISIEGEPNLELRQDEAGTNSYAVSFFDENDKRLADDAVFKKGETYKVMIVLSLTSGDYYGADAVKLASSNDIKIDKYNFATTNSYNLDYYTSLDVDMSNPSYGIVGEFSIPNPVQSIEVTNPPAKTEYYVGESFDASGMVITATYEDKSTKEVTNYDVTPKKFDSAGEQNVTITYDDEQSNKEVSTTYPVTVKELKPAPDPDQSSVQPASNDDNATASSDANSSATSSTNDAIPFIAIVAGVLILGFITFVAKRRLN